jgi:hypothetical protein
LVERFPLLQSSACETAIQRLRLQVRLQHAGRGDRLVRHSRAARCLLDGFLCESRGWSFFCDARFDARISRALELEASDLDAAVAPWARIERDIVDLGHGSSSSGPSPRVSALTTKATEQGFCEAGDGARTHDPQLGKLMLYQLSYARVVEAV